MLIFEKKLEVLAKEIKGWPKETCEAVQTKKQSSENKRLTKQLSCQPEKKNSHKIRFQNKKSFLISIFMIILI